MDKNPKTIEDLVAAKASEVNELTLKCGEKIDIRRFHRFNCSDTSVIGSYNHNGKIGVLVQLQTKAVANSEVEALAKDLSMHVAAADPKFLSGKDIDENFKNREAEIYAAQLKEEGKPQNMIEKIVQGKLKKLEMEVCLLKQKFIKDPDTEIEKLVANVTAKVSSEVKIEKFIKITLGEGIEKKSDNLADEVAKITGKH